MVDVYSDKEIAIYAINRRTVSTDAFLGISLYTFIIIRYQVEIIEKIFKKSYDTLNISCMFRMVTLKFPG